MISEARGELRCLALDAGVELDAAERALSDLDIREMATDSPLVGRAGWYPARPRATPGLRLPRQRAVTRFRRRAPRRHCRENAALSFGSETVTFAAKVRDDEGRGELARGRPRRDGRVLGVLVCTVP
jgi:hypothetical protein